MLKPGGSQRLVLLIVMTVATSVSRGTSAASNTYKRFENSDSKVSRTQFVGITNPPAEPFSESLTAGNTYGISTESESGNSSTSEFVSVQNATADSVSESHTASTYKISTESGSVYNITSKIVSVQNATVGTVSESHTASTYTISTESGSVYNSTSKIVSVQNVTAQSVSEGHTDDGKDRNTGENVTESATSTTIHKKTTLTNRPTSVKYGKTSPYDFTRNSTPTAGKGTDDALGHQTSSSESSSTDDFYQTTEPIPEPVPENRQSEDEISAFDGFRGDLVGWRRVDSREFPYVVSLMHEKFRVHICTGVLLTSNVVLSYIRCVVRRKSVADKVIYRLAEANQIIVSAGVSSSHNKEQSVQSNVDVIITAYANAFKGRLVFLLLSSPIPYSIFHRPVKMYSMNQLVIKEKLQEFVGKRFCEVVTWEDTIICLNSKVSRPKHLKAYRIKILESKTCSKQNFRLGVRHIGDWTRHKTDQHCFVGMGGRRCGSAPGGPVICGNAVYGIMSLGTSCSEFGDFTFFVPLNSTEMHYLYKRTIAIETNIGPRSGRDRANTPPSWFPIILIMSLMMLL